MRDRRDFQRVAKEKKRLVGKFLCLDYRPASFSRLGLTVPSRYGSAPERNRFKRLVREVFRLHLLSCDLEINVFPRQRAKGATFQEIRDELLQLLR